MSTKGQKTIAVNEIFDTPTIQGEGMVIGQKTIFLRTALCDYRCSWCDSSQTWDGSEKPIRMTPQEIYSKLIENITLEDGRLNSNHVTISGGNPAIWGEPMGELIDLLKEKGLRIGLETQGTIWQDWFYDIDDLTISPKPPSSGMKTDWDKLDAIVNKLDTYYSIDDSEPKFSLKVVVFNDEDFEYAKEVYNRYQPKVFYVSVGNEDAKEEGSISGRLLEKLGWLWDKVLETPEANNWRPFPQLHTLVYDNLRGV
jgi:7-carboxy-7-deazaguanine synthase